MKIRIKDNTIRLRLSQDEVTRLVREGHVHSECLMAGGKFVYSLATDSINDMEAIKIEDGIKVLISKDWTQNWDTDQRVGFDSEMSNGTKLLVEKDFKCLVPRPHEDESDLYRNPRAIEE